MSCVWKGDDACDHTKERLEITTAMFMIRRLMAAGGIRQCEHVNEKYEGKISLCIHCRHAECCCNCQHNGVNE